MNNLSNITANTRWRVRELYCQTTYQSHLGPFFKRAVLKSETVQILISTANYCNTHYVWATNVITDRYTIKSIQNLSKLNAWNKLHLDT